MKKYKELIIRFIKINFLLDTPYKPLFERILLCKLLLNSCAIVYGMYLNQASKGGMTDKFPTNLFFVYNHLTNLSLLPYKPPFGALQTSLL